MSAGLDNKLIKLQELRKRKRESEKQNREELFKEHRKNTVGESRIRSLAQKQEKALQELEKIEAKEKGEDWERKKAWDYSIQDHEDWEKKLELKARNKANAGFVNYSQLAEQSYNRDISNVNIDKEEYKKQKEKLKKMRISDGDSPVDGQNGEHLELHYTSKPSKAAVDSLVQSIKDSESRKLRRRKDYEDTDTYINDKNKQFNDKLNRHYDKYIG